jgi:putative DNA primase/helicase
VALACANGLVHLPDAAAGECVPLPHTPRFFTLNALDYDFDPAAPAPAAWGAFLGQLWPDDRQAAGTLQEWFGYVLTPDTQHQKICMLIGPKRSGKGTIARVQTGLVGPANVCGPTLAGLGTNFGLWPLLGKTVAVISDARLSGRSDTAVVVERLLSISGEDAQTVDRKCLPPVTGRLVTRFTILTNELPKMNDASGALVGRLVLLPIKRSFYGQEDTRLTERLMGELPGILNWAIEGWRRLQERGRFVQPDSGANLLGSMGDLASPVGAFVNECCEVGPGLKVEVDVLFRRWDMWCVENGRRDPGYRPAFGRDLHAAVPGLDVEQPRLADGGRTRIYVGIGLRGQARPARPAADAGLADTGGDIPF